MSFEAKDFHRLALWLVEKNTDESSLRTAISRVYYAAHLLAVEKAKNKKSFNPKGTGDDHSGVIEALKQGTTSQIAVRLRKLLHFRDHADYHLKPSDDVRGVCKHCDKFRHPSFSRVIVNQDFWEEAKDDAEAALSRLEKL